MDSETEKFQIDNLPKIINQLEKPYKSTTLPDYKIKVYGKRWLILVIFNIVSTLNAFQWVEYTIVGNIISKFYGISPFMVDMTSMIYLLVFVPLMYPASYIMDRWVCNFYLTASS